MNGNLGKLVSAGGVYEKVYEVPAAGVQFTTCFIYAVNRTAGEVTIRAAISTMNDPAIYDHIQGDLVLEAGGGTYEYPAMICQPGEKIVVYTSDPGVVFNVRGIEQT
jgi:hypothetical protein